MRWTDLTIDAGLFIGVTGSVLILRQAWQRWWPREQARGRSTSRLEGIGEIASQAAVFGGLALTAFGNLVGHVSGSELRADLWLTLVSGMAVLLVFGVQLGRLLMRWQMRRLGAVLDTESGEITPRS